MTVKLCKIKKEKFDELRKNITKDFEITGTLSFPEEVIEADSEPILIDGKPIELELDIEKYHNIATAET